MERFLFPDLNVTALFRFDFTASHFAGSVVGCSEKQSRVWCYRRTPRRIMHAAHSRAWAGKPNGNLERESSMGNVHLRNGPRDNLIGSPAPRHQANHINVDELVKENKQLRELVVQLSEIVVKNVLNRQ
jgi:hypothetical protein